MQEPKAPSNALHTPKHITMEEFEAMKPEDRQALLNYFSSFSEVMRRFFVSFEEEEQLVDSAKFEKVNSQALGGVLVVSGPSGVGKDTAIKRLK